MTVKEIVEKYLRENGYDGLYCEDCGCRLDDLIPCDWGDFQDCKAGYEQKHGDIIGEEKP